MEQAKSKQLRSRPWLREEYMVVNGFYCCYAVAESGALMVMLPGRRSATVDELRKAGSWIRLPHKVRKNDFWTPGY